jgi:hypothetical protein
MSKTTIPTGGITADAINGTLIADDAINSEHYTDGSIDTAHIGNSQVTAAKTSGVEGSGLKRLHKLTASSSSTLSFDAGDNSGAVLYDGTYKYLMWTWSLVTSADSHVRFQFSTDGGSSYECTMHAASRVLAERDVGAGTQNTFDSSAGTDSDTISNNTGFQAMTWYQTTNSAHLFHGKCELWNPQTSYPHFNVNAFYRSSGANIVNTLTHGMLSDADVDGFQMKTDSGNFGSGEIAMYGLLRA